uniref:NB-ARC domain-containing protein n=1 Tax=Nymphaea colorata TaxID=210225 RepID=A0A5K1FBX3_9MAGN|nr:unnamed protein product [Nymphaea colorata]
MGPYGCCRASYRHWPQVEDVMKLLQTEANDVRIVGIHGMGGIGKTTISKAIYNSIYRKFDGASFILNIAERSKQPNGLVDLQKQLITDLFNDISSTAPEQGISIIRHRVAYKKICLYSMTSTIETSLSHWQVNGLGFVPEAESSLQPETTDY